MKILTRDFEEIEISECDIITFPSGIFAFEDNHKFVLISPLGENVYPMWLQSVENSELCFIVFNPVEFFPDYSVSLENSDHKAIQLEKDDQNVLYLAIAVIPDNYKDATINLKSPIIINANKNLAVQVIAVESYPLKHPVFLKEE